MDERHFLDVISGQKRGVSAWALRGLLRIAVPGYAAAIKSRNWLYDRRFLRTIPADVPVVSVGNLTTGGTGKTPVVAWVANWFQEQGLRPCIVSRGFRSLESGENDEDRVLAQLCPDIPRVHNPDRVAAAMVATSSHAAQVLILDDGFQHRRLSRDLDIVLIDATRPWGYGSLLPRGLMREPRSALRRADLVLLTRVDQVGDSTLSKLYSEVRSSTGAPVIKTAFRPTHLVSLSGDRADLDQFGGRYVGAFCGIGNPAGFRGTLARAGLQLLDSAFFVYPDHHHYRLDQVKKIAEQARKQGVSALVTTLKDLVKLDPAWSLCVPIWAVSIGLEVFTDRDRLDELLSACIPETGARPSG